MSRVFRKIAIGHGKPKRTQIQFLKQQFPLTEQNRQRREMQGVDESGLQILPHCRDASSNLDVFMACCLLRALERFTDSAGHKVESCAAFHDQRLTLVMCQNEGWRMIRGIVAPPALP